MTYRENYNDLYVFMLVAREGSFTKAAAKLGIAQSGVSRTVSDLEARFGVQLLTRTTRKLSLTKAGEQLFQTTQASFQVLDAGVSTLAHFRDTPSGTVRINASQHAIDTILLPKLKVFQQRYPDIRLELISENRFVDIIEEQFDAGIRLGSDVGEGMIAVPIASPMEMVVVATGEHFQRYGFPSTPHDLDVHPCIAYQFKDGSTYDWEFVIDGKTFKHKPVGQWVFSDTYMEVAAAREGLGLAYVPESLVTQDIEHGRLICVLKSFSIRLSGLYLYYPHRNVSPALRAVIDTLRMPDSHFPIV